MLKAIFATAILGLLALVASVLSMFVEMGTDNSLSETIGVITQYGFPVHYKYVAPGMAWPSFDVTRFALNSTVWLLFVTALWLASRYHNRNKQAE